MKKKEKETIYKGLAVTPGALEGRCLVLQIQKQKFLCLLAKHIYTLSQGLFGNDRCWRGHC